MFNRKIRCILLIIIFFFNSIIIFDIVEKISVKADDITQIIPNPANGSASINCTGGVWTNLTVESDNTPFNIRFNDNLDGYWKYYGVNHSVNNGTYRWLNSDFDTVGSIYYWNTRISTDDTVYFKTNGSNYGAILDIIYKASYYANGVTYVAYQGISGDPFITCFNHSTGLWAESIKIGTNPLPDGDPHGGPQILVNHTGYIHVWYGCHGGAGVNGYIKYSISTNPYSITSWSAQSDIGTNYETYVNPTLLLNDSIVLIYRHYIHNEDWRIEYRASWDSYNTAHILVDFSSINALYPWNTEITSDGSRIYFVWHWYTYQSWITWTNLYCAYIQTSNMSYYSVDGVFLGNVSDYITETESNNYCCVINCAYNTCRDADIAVDENNYPYITYYFNNTGGSIKTINFTYWTGSSWSTSTVICDTDNYHNSARLYVWNSSDIECYAQTSGRSGEGGDIDKYSWNGTGWNHVYDVITAYGSYDVSNLNAVQNITKNNEIICLANEMHDGNPSTLLDLIAIGGNYTVGISSNIWRNDTWHFSTMNSLPIFENLSVESNPGYEGDLFYFNVSYRDIDDPGSPDIIRCVITYKDNEYINATPTWIIGDNQTGANYSYSTIINDIGLFGYKYIAYDGAGWNTTNEQYLLVQGLPGHFDAFLRINFYDTKSGLGLPYNLFKIYLSIDTNITDTDRIYYSEYNTYTGAVLYYQITDYFDNKVYPLDNNYSTVIVNQLYKYLDIPITWYSLAVKNMNDTIMHFSMTNSSRYYNVTLFPMDSYQMNILPGNYTITKNFYNAYNGTYINTLYDNLSIFDDAFYISTGYETILHISWYNTNQGLGLPDETLQLFIDGNRQISKTFYTYINRTHNITIKDYYNFTLYTGNFTMTSNYVFLDFGLTFHSWLFGNKNNDYYMISLLKDGASRWWERGIVPDGQTEFLIPSGNYTLKIYDRNWTTFYQDNYTVNRSMVFVIFGTNLSVIIMGQSVIVGQLLELRDELRQATMPDLINIACNLPYIYSIFDTKGAIIGTTLVCPYLVVTATTTNQTITNCTIYPLKPTTSISNGTILIKDDILYFEGNNSNWVNISTTSGTLIQNTSYRPNKLVLSGQNITVTSAQPITVTRETTYQQQKKFSWTKYTDTIFYTATISVINLVNSTIKQVYVYIELANDTTPKIDTVRCYDVSNGLYLTSGTNFRVSNGIEFMLDSMSGNTTRQFTCSYFGMSESQISSDAIVIVDDYNLRMYDNKNYWHLYGQWVNTGSTTFIGNLFIQFNFDTILSDGTKLICSPRSFVVYDNENNRYLNRDEYVYLGNGLQISQDAIGSVNPNSARSFDVYFLFIEEEEEGDIPQEAKNWFKTSFYGSIEYFHIIMLGLGIIAVACADIAYSKRKSTKTFKKEAWLTFIIVFIMFILWIWYTKL